MKILSYLLSLLLVSLAAICSREEEFESCDCSVQYFAASDESGDSFFLEKEVREAQYCGFSGDTLYRSPVSKLFIADCR